MAKKDGLTPEELEALPVDFPDGTAFFKTDIVGLTIHYGENEAVRFQPFQYHNNTTGETLKFGLLVTPDVEVIEIAKEDSNITELQESEYRELVKSATQGKY